MKNTDAIFLILHDLEVVLFSPESMIVTEYKRGQQDLFIIGEGVISIYWHYDKKSKKHIAYPSKGDLINEISACYLNANPPFSYMSTTHSTLAKITHEKLAEVFQKFPKI